MKKTVLAAGLLAASSAFASDFTGAYIGLQAGLNANGLEGKFKNYKNKEELPVKGNISGKIGYNGGLIAGYGFEVDEDTILGIEAKGSFGSYLKDGQDKNQVNLSERYSFGLAGVAARQVENLLPYAKLGFSYNNFKADVIKAEEKKNEEDAKAAEAAKQDQARQQQALQEAAAQDAKDKKAAREAELKAKIGELAGEELKHLEKAAGLFNPGAQLAGGAGVQVPGAENPVLKALQGQVFKDHIVEGLTKFAEIVQPKEAEQAAAQAEQQAPKKEVQASSEKESYSSFGIDFGLGVRIAVNDQLQFGIEYNGSYLLDKQLKGFNKHNVNLGVIYRFPM